MLRPAATDRCRRPVAGRAAGVHTPSDAVGPRILPTSIDEQRDAVAESARDADDADVIEQRDPSSPETRAELSGITLHSDVVAVRTRGALRSSEMPAPMDMIEGIAIRDRELRAFCRRLLGSSDAWSPMVDDAVDGLLAAVARRMPIALRGASDLVPVAYALHRRIFGTDRPFVVCDPRRREGEGSARMPPSRRTMALALEAAIDGSICLRSRRLPTDFDLLRESLRAAAAPVAMVFVCLHGEDRVRDLFFRPIEVPSLAARASESDRLLQDALDEAARALGTERPRIPRRLRDGALEGVTSFAELEKTALRIVALVCSRNPSAAAARLEMAPVSLNRWLYRRPSLVEIVEFAREFKARGDNDD